MESVMKVGRTISGGVYRAAGAVARGARRVIAAVPIFGLGSVSPDESNKESESSKNDDASINVTVRHC